MNDLQVFGFEGRNVRVVEKDGNPWWVLADVCEILGLSDVSQVAERLDDDEKLNVSSTPSLTLGQRGGWITNESGLYCVILRSDKPDAKRFRKWITSEVLPSIRKTGSYGIPKIVTPPPANLVTSVNRSVSLKILSPDQARAMIFAACNKKEKGVAKTDTPVQTPILPAIPALDTFLSLPDFAGWREKLDENPGCFEKMGVKVLKNRSGLQDLAIDHNHKILLRAAGRDYKARLKTDPRYLETRQVHIARGQVSALIFGWRAVKGGE